VALSAYSLASCRARLLLVSSFKSSSFDLFSLASASHRRRRTVPVRACSHRFLEPKCRHVLIWPRAPFMITSSLFATALLHLRCKRFKRSPSSSRIPLRANDCIPRLVSTGGFPEALSQNARHRIIRRDLNLSLAHILRCYEDHHHLATPGTERLLA
jgi:hypothetical protein